jgi:5-methylcytosine-specific restriction endonuclease McrBC regulatory subunit McrC
VESFELTGKGTAKYLLSIYRLPIPSWIVRFSPPLPYLSGRIRWNRLIIQNLDSRLSIKYSMYTSERTKNPYLGGSVLSISMF